MDDFGALNSAPPEPETTPAEAATGVAPVTAEDAPGALVPVAAGEGLLPRVAEGASDAPAAAAPSAEDPAAVAAETTAEATTELTAEAPATSGPSQVA